ncbi:hypothetical protein L9F63_017229, partial [Diploptera punctata]
TAMVEGQRHNLISCDPSSDQNFAKEKAVSRSFSFFSRTEVTEFIPVKGTISCVEVLDQWDDNTGGHAEIVNGGIGHEYVMVKITSERGRGFFFIIKVYT